jgi:alpha-beta hydrolase superfamily lysophospholipase
MTLSTAEVQEWIEKHIPHRIRAGLAITKALEKQIGTLPQRSANSREEKIVRRCETDSIWEGRIIAMRWLIELVGLTQDKYGNPIAKTQRFPSDFLIQDLPGGAPISPSSTEATTLAKVWKGSTQGTSHPTHNSSHPPVNEQELEDALAVIADHLDKTVYAAQQKKVTDVSLVPA